MSAPKKAGEGRTADPTKTDEVKSLDKIMQRAINTSGEMFVDDQEGMEQYLAELDSLEEKVSDINVPLAYTEELYQLRLHIDMLRKKLQDARDLKAKQR